MFCPVDPLLNWTLHLLFHIFDYLLNISHLLVNYNPLFYNKNTQLAKYILLKLFWSTFWLKIIVITIIIVTIIIEMYNFFQPLFHISNIINFKKPFSLLITLWMSVSFCEYYRLPLLKHMLRVFWAFGAEHPLSNTPLTAIEIKIAYTLYYFLRLKYPQLLAHKISIISKIYYVFLFSSANARSFQQYIKSFIYRRILWIKVIMI